MCNITCTGNRYIRIVQPCIKLLQIAQVRGWCKTSRIFGVYRPQQTLLMQRRVESGVIPEPSKIVSSLPRQRAVIMRALSNFVSILS